MGKDSSQALTVFFLILPNTVNRRSLLTASLNATMYFDKRRPECRKLSLPLLVAITKTKNNHYSTTTLLTSAHSALSCPMHRVRSNHCRSCWDLTWFHPSNSSLTVPVSYSNVIMEHCNKPHPYKTPSQDLLLGNPK